MQKPIKITKTDNIEIQTFADPFRDKVVKIPVTIDGDTVVMRVSEAMFPNIQALIEQDYRKRRIIVKFTRF